jgi:hypothetical protein
MGITPLVMWFHYKFHKIRSLGMYIALAFQREICMSYYETGKISLNKHFTFCLSRDDDGDELSYDGDGDVLSYILLFTRSLFVCH